MHKRNMFGVLFASIFLLGVITINASMVEASSPEVSVQPSSQTVGQEGVPLPTPPFTINISVQDVTDLYAWQIVLYYNSTILSTRGDLTIIPPENIFKGKSFFRAGPYIEYDSKGNYTIFGATLYDEPSGVAGSGLLCQINFTGQATGTSSLNLSIPTQNDVFHTYLLNSNLDEIPISSIVDGEVTVTGVGKPREPSTITIDVDHPIVDVRSNVTITGTINPTRSEVNVTISYRLAPLGTWDTLAIVQTSESSRYEYIWRTEPQYSVEEPYYTYELRAHWPGDADYTEATSHIASVTVNKIPSYITLNVYPTSVNVGSNVTMNGTITPKPTLPYENVTISYRRAGGNWTMLVSVRPDEDGFYTYTWEINEEGTYDLMGTWPGDKYFRSAETVQTVKVITEPDIMAYLPYIIAAVVITVIIVVAAIRIFSTRIRKRQPVTGTSTSR